MEKRSGVSGILLIICFVIGCFFILMAVEEYIDRTFDSNRYMLANVRTSASDSMTVWKLDKRTGAIEMCSKTADINAQVVCLKPVYIEAKDYRKPLDPDSIAKPEPGPVSAVDTVAPVAAPAHDAAQAPVKPAQ
jgi:hypothetical protein